MRTSILRLLCPLFTLALLFPRPGAAAEAEVKIPPPPAGFAIDGEPARGREIFLKKCAICHGESGDGIGRIKVRPPPRNFRDTAYMATRSDWEIYLVIRDGGPAVGMAKTMLPWQNLSEQELHDLVAFVRALGREAPPRGEDPLDLLTAKQICCTTDLLYNNSVVRHPGATAP